MKKNDRFHGWIPEHTQWVGVTLLMEISMMSSSEIEEASIGVSSPLVMVTRHNLLLKTMPVDGSSWSPEAVVEEVMDIFFLNFAFYLIFAVMWGIQQFHKSAYT